MHRILVKCISSKLNLHHCEPFLQYVGLENHEIIFFLCRQCIGLGWGPRWYFTWFYPLQGRSKVEKQIPLLPSTGPDLVYLDRRWGLTLERKVRGAIFITLRELLLGSIFALHSPPRSDQTQEAAGLQAAVQRLQPGSGTPTHCTHCRLAADFSLN